MKRLFVFFVLGIVIFSGCSNNSNSIEIADIDVGQENAFMASTLSVTTEVDYDGDDNLYYIWESRAGYFIGSGDSVDWILPSDTGMCYIVLTVTDGDIEDVDSAFVHVKDYLLEIVDIIPFPVIVAQLDTIQVSADIDYSSTGMLSYIWTASGGSFYGAGSLVHWIAPNDTGFYTIRLSVTDGEEIDSDSTLVLVNTAVYDTVLQINSITYSPMFIEFGDTIDIESSVFYSGFESITYEWSSTGGAIIGDSEEIQWIAPYDTGSFDIELIVTDGAIADTDSVTIEMFDMGSMKIYITERTGNRIDRIDDMEGTGWITYGIGGSGSGQFNCPWGIANSPFDGKIYIADQHNHRLVSIDGMSGAGWETFTGVLNNPTDIEFDRFGRIYIADTYNDRIVRIDDISGSGFVTYGPLNQPAGIKIGSDDRIYIAESQMDCIARMDDMSGTNLVRYGSSGNGINQFDTTIDIEIDSYGNIYIGDLGNDRIVRIDDISGSGWTTYGSSGSGVNNFDNPYSIALDQSGRIYIADQHNNRIVRVNDISGDGWETFDGEGTLSAPTGVAIGYGD